MPRSRELSEELRKKVVEAHQSGKGYKLISKALGLSRTTVAAILHKWKRFGTVTNLPRSGRPPKISEKMRREIMREVRKNPHTTTKDVQATLSAANISVHNSTVRKIMGVCVRPTLTGFQEGLSDKEEGTHGAYEKLSDSSDGLRKDVEVQHNSHLFMNDGCGGIIKEERYDETLGHHNEDCHGAGDASEKFRITRSRELSEELRKKVVEAHQSGKGYKLISKALGLSKTTVRAILHKWKKFGTITNLPRSGRPPKILEKAKRKIIWEVMKNPHTTTKDVQAALAVANMSVHNSTIKRIMGVCVRPTLTGLKYGLSDQGEGTHSSDGLTKDVEVENVQHDFDYQHFINYGCGGTIKEERCDESLGHHNEDCHGVCDASEKKYINDDDSYSDSSVDTIYKYDDDDEGEDVNHGIGFYNDCGGCDDYDGESWDKETEGDSTLQ